MQYDKKPLSFAQQADQLIKRGMEGDREIIIKRLRDVNYYRLSAYWFPFRVEYCEHNSLHPGTIFDVVWDRYVFDRQLRLLVMDAIERVEISIRTRLTNLITMEAGDAFVHLNRNGFPNTIDVVEQGRFVETIRRNAKRSKEVFVGHFRDKYGDKHNDLPLWMAVEVMTFGNMLTLFKMLDMHSQRDIAEVYGISAKVLNSWLLTLNYVRNLCAHHSRLWNQEFSIRPIIPAKKSHPDWHEPEISNHRIFATLTLLYYLLKKIAPQSGWATRLKELLQRHPEIPLEYMGFFESWKEHPIWNINPSTSL